MTDLSIKIEGLDKLKTALKKMPGETVNQISTAIKKSVAVLQNEAMREAPVNKQTGGGNLRQNIRSRMTTKLRGEVSSDAPYSVFVHEGTRPHEIRPTVKKALANRRTGEFFGKLVHHPGTTANRFFERAIRKSDVAVQKFFNDALQKVINMIK